MEGNYQVWAKTDRPDVLEPGELRELLAYGQLDLAARGGLSQDAAQRWHERVDRSLRLLGVELLRAELELTRPHVTIGEQAFQDEEGQESLGTAVLRSRWGLRLVVATASDRIRIAPGVAAVEQTYDLRVMSLPRDRSSPLPIPRGSQQHFTASR